MLLVGPPLTGKSSLAKHLEHGKRKILSVDPGDGGLLSAAESLLLSF